MRKLNTMLVTGVLLGSNAPALSNEGECYRSFMLSDSVRSTGTINNQPFSSLNTTKSVLHARRLSDGNSETDRVIFWLQPASDQVAESVLPADLEGGLYIPFAAEIEKSDFVVLSVRSPHVDTDLVFGQLGLVDSYQYDLQQTNGVFLRADGYVTVSQILSSGFLWMDDEVQIERREFFDMDMDKLTEVQMESSSIRVEPSPCLLEHASGHEVVITDYTGLESKVKLDRHFSLNRSDSDRLSDDHWFHSLPYDVSKWPWKPSIIEALSIRDAESAFENEIDTLLDIHEDGVALRDWIIDNMAMLKHLGSILSTAEIDDELSKDLFRVLGALNSTDAIDVLSDVVVNEGAGEDNRYRALVALEGTDAPFSEAAMADIIDYSATPRAEYDHVEQASLMLLGTYAGKRAHRVPEQSRQFESAVIDSINDPIIPPIYSLSAAGNAQKGASEDLVAAVETMLIQSPESEAKRVGAESLLKMGRTDLSVDAVHQLITEDTGSLAKEQLVLLSPMTEGASQSAQLRSTLFAISADTGNPSELRVSAVQALGQLGFGETQQEREQILRMVAGEADKDVSGSLMKLWKR